MSSKWSIAAAFLLGASLCQSASAAPTWWGQAGTAGALVELWANDEFVSTGDRVAVTETLSDTYYRNEAYVTETSFGYANLATGQLGVSGFGQVQMYDVLTFSAPGKSSTDSFSLPVRISVNGNLYFDPYNAQMPQAGISFVFSGARITASWQGVTPFTNYTTDTAQFILHDKIGSWTKAGPSIFEGVATVPYETPVYFAMAMGASFGDFSHTATLNLEIPEGTSMGSVSGVFLTAPVPEPETYAMMMAGLGLLGGIARRRKTLAN